MASIVKKNTKSNIPTWLIRVSVGKNFDTGKYIYHNEIFKGSKDGALKRVDELECNKSKISITLKKDHLFESLVKLILTSKSVLKSIQLASISSAFALTNHS